MATDIRASCPDCGDVLFEVAATTGLCRNGVMERLAYTCPARGQVRVRKLNCAHQRLLTASGVRCVELPEPDHPDEELDEIDLDA